MADDLRDTLRRIRVFGSDLPRFDPAGAPATPQALFREWFDAAIAAGVAQPQAMVLSTVDTTGLPDARVLLLKRQLDDRWGFATSRLSAKGRQLDRTPCAALTFSWSAQGRQVRVRGPVQDAGDDEARRDFLARPPASRRESWLPNQSAVLEDPADLTEAQARADAEIAHQPDTVPAHWRVYDVVAEAVEFWQADADRRHVRLRYRRDPGDGWTREALWP